MIRLENMLKACHYQISEGNDYLWKCFGENVMSLDFNSDLSDKLSNCVTIVFDKITHEVYTIECWPYECSVFRYVQPEYLERYNQEYTNLYLNREMATDETKYVDVTDEDTILHIAELCILEGDCKQFENGDVIINMDLEDDVLIALSLEAHRKNITLNDLIVQILKNKIDELNAEVKG